MSISYKDAIKSSMQSISEKKEAVFIGYNLKYGSRCYGTMDTIPEDKIYEMPVAEDLNLVEISIEYLLLILIINLHTIYNLKQNMVVCKKLILKLMRHIKY